MSGALVEERVVARPVGRAAEEGIVLHRFQAWCHAPATMGDVLMIALAVVWLIGGLFAVSAENSAKRYADDLFKRLRS